MNRIYYSTHCTKKQKKEIIKKIGDNIHDDGVNLELLNQEIETGLLLVISKIKVNRGNLKVMVIEPHPDDAALSMGGTLLKLLDNGVNLCCLCIFNNGGLKESIRRQENRLVWEKMLQSKLEFADLFDYIYRKEATINNLKIFHTVCKIIEAKISKEKPDIIIGPMGVGEHIDHIIVNDAIIYLTNKHQFHLYFYEDYPYVDQFRYSLSNAIIHLQNKIRISPIYVDITNKIADKSSLNMVYQSQYKFQKSKIMHTFTRYAQGVCLEARIIRKINNDNKLYERLWCNEKEFLDKSIFD